MRDLTLAFPKSLTNKKTKQLNVFKWNIALLGLITLMGITYLFIVNSLSTAGFKIRNLEQQVAKLEEENKHLQILSSDLGSIDKIQETAKQLNFVPVTNVSYLKDSDFALK